MSAHRRYTVSIHWTHRRDGPQVSRLKQDATSIRRAINQGLLAFFTTEKETARARKIKRHYLDAHKHLRVEAWRL